MARLPVLLFALACTIVGLQAQNPVAAMPAGSPGLAMKSPVVTSAPVLVGADVRVRNEFFNDALTLSGVAPLHEQDLVRIRARFWANIKLAPDFTLNTRLAAEPRAWEEPAFAKQHPGTGMEWRYALLDVCNVKWTRAFDLPLTITAGRQDLQFGDPLNWWLVGDGTPGEGSWTLFLDSIRATLDLPASKSKLDLVVIDQHARPDSWLPIAGRESTYGLTEQNERGAILYYSNQSLPKAQVDGYFIFKRDDPVFANSDTADIYTAGGKLTGTPNPHWRYSAEAAWQWGSKLDPSVRTPVNVGAVRRDIQAYGANAKLTYLWKDPRDNQLSLVGELLSGDDPGTTGKDEMFDVLWGRWPRFSELYIYSYPMETSGKIAQLNNLLRIGATWTFVPAKGSTIQLAYNAWFAPESEPTRAMNSALFSQTGHFRGHFLQMFWKRQFSRHVATQAWLEFVKQGDFYARRDTLSYWRAEILYTF